MPHTERVRRKLSREQGVGGMQWAVTFSSSVWKLGNRLLKWRLPSLGILLEGYK